MFRTGDRYYTNGVQVHHSVVQEPSQDSQDRIRWLDQDWLPIYGRPGERRVNTYVLGQQMFTPSNITIATPQPNDRPWAGWLYAGAFFSRASEDELATLGLTLGIVGPASGASAVQEWVHRIIHSPSVRDPEGWDNQLKNEPGFILTYQRTWRLGAGQRGSLGWDILSNAGAAVGNIYVQASAGALARIGWHLPQDFGEGGLRPGSASTLAPDILPLQDPRGWRFYFFAGLQIVAVAHDLFLSGNSFRDGPHVSAEPIVGYFNGGLTLAYDDLRFTFRVRYETEAFRNQRDGQLSQAMTVTARF